MRRRKRAACLMLGLMLMTVSAAKGEALNGLGVYDSKKSPAYTSFQAAHPGVSLEDKGGYCEGTDGYIAALVSAQAPFDLIGLSTHQVDWRRLAKEGYLADLSGSQAIQSALGRMPESLRQAVSMDGKVYGLPVSIAFTGLRWCGEAWAAAGLTEADVPTTYPELLDFLDAWAQRIQKAPMPDISVNNLFDESLYSVGSYTEYLTSLLVESVILQSEYAGEKPRFDTPEIRALLDRAKLIGEKLYAAEPRKKGSMALFHNSINSWTLYGIHDTLTHEIPLRLTLEQPALFQVSLGILCAGASSAQPDLAIAYIENKADHLEDYARTYLYLDSPPLERGDLEEQFQDQQGWIDESTRMLSVLDPNDPAYTEYAASLAQQKEMMEYIHTDEYRFLISADDLADFRQCADRLYCPAPGLYGSYTKGSTPKRQLIRQFAGGEIGVEMFLKGLEGAVE